MRSSRLAGANAYRRALMSGRWIAAALVVSAIPLTAASTPATAQTATSALHAVSPCRLADTRSGAVPAAGSTLPVAVAGRCGVPVDATAVAITVTVTDAVGAGHATAWPSGRSRPNASLVNYERGDTIANSGLIGLGDDGRLSLNLAGSAHAIVDVTAYFAPTATATDGRFVPLTATRLADTRGGGRLAPGSTLRVTAPMVPADATAVAVNLTTTGSTGPGYFTAFAAGAGRPDASVLNVDGAGQTRAAAAIVPVTGRAFDVFASNGGDLVVDITGYFTGPSAPASGDGLFVATHPSRVLDTRGPDGPHGGPRVFSSGAREVDPSPFVGSSAAVAANVTVTQTLRGGWWRVGPAGRAAGAVSTLNADRARQTVANGLVTAVSDRGLVVEASVSSDVVIDVTGYFTGAPLTADRPTPSNPAPRRRVTIIGDSAAAGMRWNRAYGGFQGFDAVPHLESCRRLVTPSCNGREGYSPLTAYAHILYLPEPTTDDILVIATGYNDSEGRFSSDFDQVVAAARFRGFRHIVWVTYRESELYRLPGDLPIQFASYEEMNRILREKATSGRYPELELWDLHRYTLGAHVWFDADGVHQEPLGSWGIADWISRHVAAHDGKPCPKPWFPHWNPDAVCPDPDGLPELIGHPAIAELYPVEF